MVRNIDISLLRTFVAVADKASMTVAGNALHLTQGAVSQQIRRLEDLLGDPLLDRDRRGQRLTPAGERLLGKARQMLSLNDEIWREMTARGAEGRVRFGLPHDLVGAFMAPVLKSFTDAYPKVELSLTCGASPDLLVALSNGEIDIAVIEEPAGRSNGECLGLERLVWVGAPGGRAQFKRPLPVSMIADTCAFRPPVLAALAEAGIAWRTVFESGSVEATAAMVHTDLAVTAWLVATVPAGLEVLDQASGLPALPSFAINLHLPRSGADLPATALARHVRERFLRGQQAA
jgi:DNA-binding transcriptional LysR family regulator